jgi:hypothetical protein
MVYWGVSNAMKLPTTDRDDIVKWVADAYYKVSENSIQGTSTRLTASVPSLRETLVICQQL